MLPLIARHTPADPLLIHRGRAVSAACFLADARALAAELPDRRHAFNCCEDRYRFTVGFAAVLLRGQTNLLPPTRAPELLRQIAEDYPDSYTLHDGQPGPAELPAVHNRADGEQLAESLAIPVIPPAQLAALVFTSGSTGKPKPNRKTWDSLVSGTRLAAACFLDGLNSTPSVLGTVPPQHMYGLETTVLFALQGGAMVHSGRPLFPADVAAALTELPPPRVLVTTPFHLRACMKSGLKFPPVAFVISATAPLARELAAEAETWLGAPVREIYGCTEAGSLASRRTVDGERWSMYPDMLIGQTAGGPVMAGPQLAEAVPFPDVIEVFDTGHFALRGRSSDMLNIAGKRASMADLIHQLLSIPGVEDGVMLLPDESSQADGQHIARLAALVVAPTLSEPEILDKLRARLDPAFLPRPLFKVARLPRSDTSKLPRAALLQLLQELGRRHA